MKCSAWVTYVFQQRCMERIRSIINAGTTVLFVSHNLKVRHRNL